MKAKIVALDKLIRIGDGCRAQGKKIVSAGGCFDILHAGHIAYLEEAAALGDLLVIFLNSDHSVHRLKGMERPVVPQAERAAVLAGVGCVDYICLFDEQSPCECIRKVKPDIFVKGSEYQGRPIPETEVLHSYGGRVEFINMVNGCSTTNIIQKIREGYRE